MLRNRFSLRYDQRVQLDNIPLGEGHHGSRGHIARSRCWRAIPADPRYIASHPGIRSEVAVPLIVKDRVLGVMDLESERIGYFTEDHVRTLALIAPQIAISVENARLYEELAEREQRIEEDLEAARKLQTIMMPARRRRSSQDSMSASGCGRRADQRRPLRFLRARR